MCRAVQYCTAQFCTGDTNEPDICSVTPPPRGHTACIAAVQHATPTAFWALAWAVCPAPALPHFCQVLTALQLTLLALYAW
jgi:hypothetical protein